MNQSSKIMIWVLSGILVVALVAVSMAYFISTSHSGSSQSNAAGTSTSSSQFATPSTKTETKSATVTTTVNPDGGRYGSQGTTYDESKAIPDKVGMDKGVTPNYQIPEGKKGYQAPKRLLRHGETDYGNQLAAHLKYSRKVADPYSYPDNEWYSWDRVIPGMAYKTNQSRCTLGAIGETKNGDYVGISAGHCLHDGDTAEVYYSNDGQSITQFGAMTTVQDNVNKSNHYNSGFNGITDYSVIEFGKNISGDRKVANTYTISDVLSGSELAPGMEICKFGFRTEETCGPILAANDTMVRANIHSRKGDSGSLGYVKKQDGTVAAVGILSSGFSEKSEEGSDDPIRSPLTNFALLEPILEYHQLDVVFQ